MLLQRVMIAWMMAATALAFVAAHAAEVAPAAPVPAIESPPPVAVPAPAVQAPAEPPESVPSKPRPAGLIYQLDPVPEARTDGLRFDFEQRPAAVSAPKLSAAASAPKSGWAVSGRAGPLRWLTPIDGEGETTVRLWGRIADQPRTPGMGLFNMSIHYNFE